MSQKVSREKEIIREGIIGIAANILLSATKAVIGLLANSIAIVLDAVNNLTDILSSLLTIIGMKLACMPADKEHPFGHGRYEYLSTIAVSFVIIAAGAISLFSSFNKLLKPEPTEYKWYSLAVLIIAVIAKIIISLYFKKEGEKTESEALAAIGIDAKFDAVITFSTLTAAIATIVLGPQVARLDGALGIMISIIIIRAGIKMVLSPLDQLLGVRVDHAKVNAIKQEISSHEKVIGVYDMLLHNYGHDNIIGSANIEVMDTMTAHEIYDLTKEIQKTILKKHGIFLTIGIYAKNSPEEETGRMREEITAILKDSPNVIQVQGLYIDPKDKTISFDTVIDFKTKDLGKARKNLASRVSAAYPDYKVENVVSRDYSTSE